MKKSVLQGVNLETASSKVASKVEALGIASSKVAPKAEALGIVSSKVVLKAEALAIVNLKAAQKAEALKDVEVAVHLGALKVATVLNMGVRALMAGVNNARVAM